MQMKLCSRFCSDKMDSKSPLFSTMDSDNIALAVVLFVIAAVVGLAAVIDFVRHFVFNGIELAVVEPTVLGMQSLLAVPELIEQFSSSSQQTARPHPMMSFRVNLSLIEYERSFMEEEMALLLNGVVASQSA